MNEETTAQVTDLVQRYKKDEKGVMSYKKDIDAILKREGGIVKRKLRPRQVATHFDNRDKKMISVGGMYERAGKLLGVGFDIKVLEEEACTIEDHPMTREIAKQAIKLYESDSRFAQLHEKDIEVGSVGGSHTIHWMAAVESERPCDNEKLAHEGVINKHAWYAFDDFRLGCEEGINIWVIRWQIAEKWPEIPMIYQSALNARQHVGSGTRKDFLVERRGGEGERKR